MRAEDFINIIQPKNEQKPDIFLKFGFVDPAYTTGRPKILFDGTEEVSVKEYPYIGAVAANDRVMILQNVVLGKIN